MYGPLYPAIYLLTAFGLLFCYVSTRYGIVRWYQKQPAVDDDMMASMRSTLSVVIAVMIVVQTLGVFAAIDNESIGFGSAAAAIGAPTAWLVYALVPLERFSYFKDYEQDEGAEDGGEGDTGGMRWDEVTKLKQIEMEPYICPKLTKRIYDALAEEEEYAKATIAAAGDSTGDAAPAAKPKAADDDDDDDDEEEEKKDCLDSLCVIS